MKYDDILHPKQKIGKTKDQPHPGRKMPELFLLYIFHEISIVLPF